MVEYNWRTFSVRIRMWRFCDVLVIGLLQATCRFIFFGGVACGCFLLGLVYCVVAELGL